MERLRSIHINAPFFTERRKYLEERRNAGYRMQTLQYMARHLLWYTKKFESRISQRRLISLEEVCQASKKWSKSGCNNKYKKKYFVKQFEREVSNCLDSIGKLNRSDKANPVYLKFISKYASHMSDEKGLSANTISHRRWTLGKFLSWYFKKKRSLYYVGPSDIDAFFDQLSKKGCSRYTLAKFATDLREFFRFAKGQGWCQKNIADLIESPRIYRHESIPAGPSWEDIKKLISSTDTGLPRDIRDRAIIMLFSIYGLRSSEVANLKIQDFDWENDQFKVRRVKSRKVQSFPISVEVGNAIIEYIKVVRPRTKRKELFVTFTPPYSSISRGALFYVVNSRIKELNIKSRRKSPHALRHSFATRLLAKNCTMKQISDHLGHSNIKSTSIYAKVNINQLREVADFNFGNAL